MRQLVQQKQATQDLTERIIYQVSTSPESSSYLEDICCMIDLLISKRMTTISSVIQHESVTTTTTPSMPLVETPKLSAPRLSDVPALIYGGGHFFYCNGYISSNMSTCAPIGITNYKKCAAYGSSVLSCLTSDIQLKHPIFPAVLSLSPSSSSSGGTSDVLLLNLHATKHLPSMLKSA